MIKLTPPSDFMRPFFVLAWLVSVSMLPGFAVAAPPDSGAYQRMDSAQPKYQKVTHYTDDPLLDPYPANYSPTDKVNPAVRYPDWWFDEPEGWTFERYLAQGYKRYAKLEDHQHDFEAAKLFAGRAGNAANNLLVSPEEMSQRRLPDYAVSDLTNARMRLMRAFGQGSKSALPKVSAAAQVMFDCWMEQQEENIQPHDVAACRRGALDAIYTIECLMKIAGACTPPAPAPAPVRVVVPAPAVSQTPTPVNFIVYFDFDKDVLTTASRTVVQHAAKVYKGRDYSGIVLSGHADRAGADQYNINLSDRRRKAVVDALIMYGIPVAAVDASHFGEHQPRVKTRDGVRNQDNRRVEITLESDKPVR